ncbi:MAG: 2-oxoacid:acceptor oxidoreductase family protein [Chloroflexi bacterium]|nr:2-oxoacid:acceptor oxidoreductase family protein [Chloroflexota bacterium]
MRREVRFAGFGGQGIALAGYIVGKAAAVHDDKYAVLRQSYGPESRGGASAAEVIIDDVPVDYPEVTDPTCLVLMSREALHKYIGSATPGGTVIVDSDLTEDCDWGDRYSVHLIPATRIAEQLGRRIVANMVVVGFFTAVTGFVSRGAVEQAIRTTVSARTLELNLKAFSNGYAVGAGLEVPA